MPDVVLINPPSRSGYGDLADELSAIEPPAWSRMIAGYLHDRGFRVSIIDADCERMSAEQVADEIAWMPELPRLAAVVVHGHQPSASTQLMDAADAVAAAISRRVGIVRTIVIGGHPSALPGSTLANSSFDYACVGEGPITIAGLLCGDKPHEIPGLVWWSQVNDAPKVNGRAPLLPMSELHGNVWGMLPPLDRYRAHNWQVLDGTPRSPYASVYTTLGCCFACRFCMINAPFGSRDYRMRDPEAVASEIVSLHKSFGVRAFKIIDEMFVLNPRHYGEICNHLIASGVADDLNIWAYARVDTVRPDRLKQLRNAGFRWLALGIESASSYVMDGAQKRLKNKDIVGVVRAVQDAGINVIGNFIFGLPDDTIESMQETFKLAVELNCEFANFYCAQAYPGSALYDEAVRDGWPLPETWDGYSQHGFETRPLGTRTLSPAIVLAFRDQAFDAYFGSARYLDMIQGKFGSDAVMQLQGMRERKIARRLLNGNAARDLPYMLVDAGAVPAAAIHAGSPENAPVTP